MFEFNPGEEGTAVCESSSPVGTLTRYFYDPDGIFDASTFVDNGDGSYQISLTLAASIEATGMDTADGYWYGLYATDGNNVFKSNWAKLNIYCGIPSTTLTVPTTEDFDYTQRFLI